MNFVSIFGVEYILCKPYEVIDQRLSPHFRCSFERPYLIGKYPINWQPSDILILAGESLGSGKHAGVRRKAKSLDSNAAVFVVHFHEALKVSVELYLYITVRSIYWQHPLIDNPRSNQHVRSNLTTFIQLVCSTSKCIMIRIMEIRRWRFYPAYSAIQQSSNQLQVNTHTTYTYT